MKSKKTFAVIGLGRFGQSVVRGLLEAKATVMVFDCEPEKVAKFADYVSYSAVLDTSDEEALAESGINNADHVIVAIGSDSQASIVTIALLTEMGIKNITVKSNSPNLEKIYRRLGVEDIISPERDSGYRTALRLTHDSGIIKDYIDIGSKLAMVRLSIINPKLLNESLANLNLRSKFEINIIAIHRKEDYFIPGASDVIYQEDELLIIGKEGELNNFESYAAKK